jgi:hypothetical protein
MAGEDTKSRRSDMERSLPSVPACTNTQRSFGTPRAAARSAEQTMTADDMSTSGFDTMRLVYGNPTSRLSGVGVVISSAV